MCARAHVRRRICGSMCICVCVHTIRGQRLTLGCSLGAITLFVEKESLLQHGWLVSEPQGSSGFHTLALGLQECSIPLGFLTGYWALNPGPCALQ